MNKQEFLVQLQERLKRLPRREATERLDFYEEMIDDRMEEGVSEEDAVAEIGAIDDIVAQITEEIAETKGRKKQSRKKRRMRGWEIALLVLGSPLWLSLLIAAFAVVFSVGVSLWAAMISLWVATLSLAVGTLGGFVAFIVAICLGEVPVGLLVLAATFVCASLAIFWCLGCQYATKGLIRLTKTICRGIFGCFVRRRMKDEE